MSGKMMKSFVSLFVVVVVMMEFARSQCCEKTKIKFQLTAGGSLTCFDIDGAYLADGGNNLRWDNCEIEICGDGQLPAAGGDFCGSGRCAMGGCHCDNGCVPGNAFDNFARIHADKLSHARQDRRFNNAIGTTTPIWNWGLGNLDSTAPEMANSNSNSNPKPGNWPW